MSELAINYDKKYDILYVDIPSTEPKYGEAGDNGIVTFFGMESNKVLGFFIENFVAQMDNVIDIEAARPHMI